MLTYCTDAETPGKINLPGLEKFFSDLGVDIYSDVLVLVIAFYSAQQRGDRGFFARNV
jgi:hypothetical protein